MQSASDASGTQEQVEAAKVVRMTSMVASLLDELHRCPVDEVGRERTQNIYQAAVTEVAGGLSQDLQTELERMRPPMAEGRVSESELRIAHAQLVGWLEGLVHGMQAAMTAQQLAAETQLQRIREQPSRQPQHPAGDTTYL